MTPNRGRRPGGRVIGGLVPVLVALVSVLVPVLGAVSLAAPASTSAAAAASAPTLSTVVIPDLGPGYSVTSQGPLNPSQFASDSPDPSAASGALTTLAKTMSTYERVWQTSNSLNQVQDLVVRFPSTTGAKVFEQAAQQSLDHGEIVQKGPLPSIPGAQRVTYFAATNEDGVGEAITMSSGVYVALLSFFSAAAGNPQPISPADAETVAQAQYKAMVAVPGGTPAPSGRTASAATASAKKVTTSSAIWWAVLVVIVLAVAVATPLLLRRRQERAHAHQPLPNG